MHKNGDALIQVLEHLQRLLASSEIQVHKHLANQGRRFEWEVALKHSGGEARNQGNLRDARMEGGFSNGSRRSLAHWRRECGSEKPKST